MEALTTIFLVGAFGVVGALVAAAGLVEAFWFPLALALAFCVAITVLALVLSHASRRRDLKRRLRARRSHQTVQTMQIKVEADTCQATAAIAQLESRVQACAAKIEALNRLAGYAVKGEA